MKNAAGYHPVTVTPSTTGAPIDELEQKIQKQIFVLEKLGTFGHVGDDDADEEDDGVEPVVAQDAGNQEEAHSEEDSDRGDLKAAAVEGPRLPRTGA